MRKGKRLLLAFLLCGTFVFSLTARGQEDAFIQTGTEEMSQENLPAEERENPTEEPEAPAAGTETLPENTEEETGAEEPETPAEEPETVNPQETGKETPAEGKTQAETGREELPAEKPLTEEKDSPSGEPFAEEKEASDAEGFTEGTLTVTLEEAAAGDSSRAYFSWEGLGYDYGWLGRHLCPKGELNGREAVCLTPEIPVPEAGDYPADIRFVEDGPALKLLYYGFTGPGDVTGEYIAQENDRMTLTHLALALYWQETGASYANETGKALAAAFTEKVLSLPEPEGQALLVREKTTGFAAIAWLGEEKPASAADGLLRAAGPLGDTVRVVSEAGAGYYYDYVGYGDGTNNGIDRFIYLNGSETYCVAPKRHQPTTGTYSSSYVTRITDPLLVNLLYFGYHGPGDLTNRPEFIPSGTNNASWSRHTLTHIALTKVYESIYGGDSWSYGVGASGITRVNQFIALVQARMDAGQGVAGYAALFNDRLTYNGNPTQNTLTLVSSFYPSGSFRLTKVSADPEASAQNPESSLEGAVYTLGNYAEYIITQNRLELAVTGSEEPEHRMAIWDVTAGERPVWHKMVRSGSLWLASIDISAYGEGDIFSIHIYDGSGRVFLWGKNDFVKDPTLYGTRQYLYHPRYRLTTDADGIAALDKVVTNTYILREVSPSPGFLLDEGQYTVDIQGGRENTLTVEEVPEPKKEGTASLTVEKIIYADELWDSHGLPVFAAEARAELPGGESLVLTHTFVFTPEVIAANTAADGRVCLSFTWTGLPYGTYTVREILTDDRYTGTIADENGGSLTGNAEGKYYPSLVRIRLDGEDADGYAALTNRKTSYALDSHITAVINTLPRQ